MKLEGGYVKKGVPFEPEAGKPVVTIVTATYNAAKYLEATIESVLNQTYPNIEFILVDGNSKDNTLSVIQKFDDKITYWLSEPDRGVYDAWNKAVKVSSGEWICFVGADDILLPSAIEDYIVHISGLQQQPDFVSSKVEIVKDDLTLIREYGTGWAWNSFKVYMTVAHVGALHHRSYFEKFGYFDDSYKIAADYELLLRAKDILKASFLNSTTVKMRTGGLSQNYLKVFEETRLAKVKSARRNAILCRLEYFIAIGKFYLRKLVTP